MTGSDKVEGVVLVPKTLKRELTERQLIDFRSEQEDFIKWSLTFGKDPSKMEGYSGTTVRSRGYRVASFYKWVWEQEERYTTALTHSHADEYMKHLAYGDSSQDNKANTQKALKMLFRWRKHERGDNSWEPDLTFRNNSSSTTKRDYLTREERVKVREASLEYGSIPHYNAVSPSERDQWKRYLSQRFGVSKDEVGLDEWERANGWKIPSLVYTSLDCGLRPIEIERAETSWVDLDNGVLRIPKGGSQKDDADWDPSLRSSTVKVLSKWLEQRRHIDGYDETDTLWLTQKGNPYQSASLAGLLRNLCDEAQIPRENRQMTWYSIRRSTTTMMISEGNLSAAQNQLRHHDPKTTMRYDQSSTNERRDILDRMG